MKPAFFLVEIDLTRWQKKLGHQSKDSRRSRPFSGLWTFQEPSDSVQTKNFRARSKSFENWRQRTLPIRPSSKIELAKLQSQNKFRRGDQMQPASKWSGSVASIPIGSNSCWSVTPAATASPSRPLCETILDLTRVNSHSHAGAASKCSHRPPTGTVTRSARSADFRRWL